MTISTERQFFSCFQLFGCGLNEILVPYLGLSRIIPFLTCMGCLQHANLGCWWGHWWSPALQCLQDSLAVLPWQFNGFTANWAAVRGNIFLPCMTVICLKRVACICHKRRFHWDGGEWAGSSLLFLSEQLYLWFQKPALTVISMLKGVLPK